MPRVSLRTQMIAMLLGVALLGVAGVLWRIQSLLQSQHISHEQQVDSENSQREGYFASMLPRLVSAINAGDSIAIYEGLPHDHFEKDLYRREVLLRQTVKLRDFNFYSPAIQLHNAEDAQVLRSILSSPDSYAPWSGPKLCGGFHPDWAIEFGHGSDKVQVLICFGCDEIRLYGGAEGVWTNVKESAIQSCSNLLQGYRRRRPQPTRARE